MMEFRIRDHGVLKRQMVQVWRDGEFVAGVYSHQDGIQVVSPYLDGVQHESGQLPSVLVMLSSASGTGEAATPGGGGT